ncbi:hypothetical protein [Streptomyces griseoaurantiacus]|uniref:hypothetical protein n=1 Tax=Streptomyces griseoaurantiacus TaxID=68213 RepID=UPI000592B994|nr:hypothetical protein [Streptomyces griseoaurantiacus]
MSDDPLQRLAESVAEITEEEAAALLSALGVRREQDRSVQAPPTTPLPGPASSSGVHSEVEWV